ncbi:MAG: M15 family metallopeptidase [Oscillospiraceae bacterium]
MAGSNRKGARGRKKKRSKGPVLLATMLAVTAMSMWGWAYFSGALDKGPSGTVQQGSLAASGEGSEGEELKKPQDNIKEESSETGAQGGETLKREEETPTATPEEPPVNKPEKPSAESGGEGIIPGLKNGVKLYERDGVTYLDIHGHEMLLVNKKYHLPSSYGNGMTSETQAAFDKMAAAMKTDGLTVWNGSGFRSYDTQAAIFSRYAAGNGEEAANRYSARPGQSEHQTGLALDIAGGDGSTFLKRSFEDTAEFAWLDRHAAEYGFVLRFLKDREVATGYIYEPWHYRYVGVELAKILKESGVSIEEYAGLA